MKGSAKARWIGLLTLAVILVLAVAACAPQQAAQAPQTGGSPKAATSAPERGGTLRMGLDAEPGGLDGFKVSGAPIRRYSRFVYNTLTNRGDESGTVVPELAESWSSADNQTWTFKLRKGVKFQDGTDFNAEAVKFNFERVMAPEALAVSKQHFASAGLSSIDVVDDSTVRFNLKTPNATFPVYLTHSAITAIYSPTAVKKWGDQYLLHPVGTGPYELVEWVKGDHVTLKRFDGYWRKDQQGNSLPYLDQIILKPIPDETVRFNAVRAGDLDLVDYIGPQDEATAKADPNLKVVSWGNSRMSLLLSCAEGVFKNKALRQAVAWAVDREAIHKAVYGGTGAPANSILDPKNWAYDAQGKFYARDLAKAKEKLAEGGQPNGFKFEAQEYNTPLDLRVAQAVKDQLAEAGIVMEIKPNERQLQSNILSSKKFEAAFTTGYGLEDPDVELTRWLDSKGEFNFANCSDPQIEPLLVKARQVVDKNERKALYGQIQALALDGSPMLLLHHSVLISAMRKEVEGFAPNIDLLSMQYDWLWLRK